MMLIKRCKFCDIATNDPAFGYATIDEHTEKEHFLPSSEPGDKYLRDNAAKEGLTYTDYCKKYGLLSPTYERQIRRREVPLDMSNG